MKPATLEEAESNTFVVAEADGAPAGGGEGEESRRRFDGRWLYWASKGTLAVLDQALLSGSNFALSVLLARWLQEEEYGAYVVTFSVFILLGTVHQALLLVPSLVLGNTLYRERRRGYFGALIRLHILLSVIFSTALAVTAAGFWWIAPEGHMASSFAGLTLALPCVLLYWLARTAPYLDFQPEMAVVGGLAYCVVLLGGVFLLRQWELLSALTGFAAMALSSLSFSAVLLWRLKPIVWSEQGRVSAREVWRSSWVYGRWELAIAVSLWLPAFLCYPLTAGIVGASGAGALRAMHNLALPVGHAVTAVLRLAQPYVSAHFGRGGQGSTARSVQRLALLGMTGTSAYVLVVSVFREPIMAAFYGGKFQEAVALVPWMLVTTVFWAGVEGLGVGLRAMRSSRSLFLAYLAASAFFLVVGAPAALAAGLAGVVATMAATSGVALVTIAFLFKREAAAQRETLESAEA